MVPLCFNFYCDDWKYFFTQLYSSLLKMHDTWLSMVTLQQILFLFLSLFVFFFFSFISILSGPLPYWCFSMEKWDHYKECTRLCPLLYLLWSFMLSTKKPRTKRVGCNRIWLNPSFAYILACNQFVKHIKVRLLAKIKDWLEIRVDLYDVQLRSGLISLGGMGILKKWVSMVVLIFSQLHLGMEEVVLERWLDVECLVWLS